MSSLGLIKKLIDSNEQKVLYNLIIRNLRPRNHLQSNATNQIGEESVLAMSRCETKWILYLQLIFQKRYFCLIPTNEFGMSSSNWDAYVEEASQSIFATRKICLQSWAKDSIVAISEDKDKISDCQLSEQQLNHGDMPNEYFVNVWNGGGLFFNCLLARLEHFTENSVEVNLLLSGIIAKLATFPYPLLHLFILDGSLKVRPGVKTVWTTLQFVNF